MVPFADMINHNHPKKTDWYYDDVKQCYVTRALVDIAADEAITCSYGEPVSNFKLFMVYGFLFQKNIGDQI